MIQSYYLQNLALGIIIFISAQISFQFAFTEGNVSLFWVPMGISLASFLFLGTKMWLGVIVGVFLANLSTNAAWELAIGSAIANTAEPWLGTILMTQWETRQELDTVGDTLKFLVIGVIIAPLLGAFIGSSFCLTYQCPNDLINIFWQWVVGDAMGVLIITPLLLSLVKPSYPNLKTKKTLTITLGFVLLILTNLLVFGIIPNPYLNPEIYSLQYLCFPFLMWAGYKLTQRGATTAIFLTVVIAIVGTMQGNSPFSQDRVENSLLLLWSFVGVVAIPTLLLSAARSERAAVEDRLKHLAYNDPLTKLPNRVAFFKAVNDFINSCKIDQKNENCVVLILDLNHFKEVNDSFGHQVGDKFLYQVARRLEKITPKKDFLARLGGDEFGIFIPHISHLKEAVTFSMEILEQFQNSFILDDDCEYLFTPTIGINLGNCGYENSEDIVRDANIAMSNAKMNQKKYCIFDQQMLEERRSKLKLEQKLRQAISQEELSLVYQPVVDLKSGEVTGFEALIRWDHSTQGRVSPARFIPLAEETGLISEIGDWILDQACYQLQQWEKLNFYGNNLTLSVNISPKQLKERDLVKQIDDLIQKYQINPHCLKLEITETTVLEIDANPILKNIKKLGVGLYLDDFGMGESSLSRLYQLPLDVMKIDRAFVQGIPKNQRKSAIAQTIINLATSMELRVIAEGIETEAQRQQLLDWGCEKGQGFLFYKPLTVKKATEIISSKLGSGKQ
ncbi:MAG: EAL domain-containing protein [Cyanobacteriota bacterium]